MSVLKSPFTVRIDNSVQEKVRALAKQEGQSINKTAEKTIIKGLRYDEDIQALKAEISVLRGQALSIVRGK